MFVATEERTFPDESDITRDEMLRNSTLYGFFLNLVNSAKRMGRRAKTIIPVMIRSMKRNEGTAITVFSTYAERNRSVNEK